MIGLDTNVLLRYIVQDDPIQSKCATEYIESHCSVSNAGFINLIVICEIVWVLKKAYGYNKEIIIDVIKRLLSTKEFIIENSDIVWQAVKEYSNGKAGLADFLIGCSNKNKGCGYTITFDKQSAQGENFRLLKN